MIQHKHDSIFRRRSGGAKAARFVGGIAPAMTALTAMTAMIVMIVMTGMTGCGEDNQASAIVASASHTMAAINAGGGQTVNAPHREDTYDRVIGMLRPVVSGSSGATRSSAQVITAQAMAGKGRIEGARAAQLENRCSTLVSAALNEADLFAAHSALASALVTYDAQPEFDDLRAQTIQINEQIEAVRARIRGIDERIAQLQQRSDAAREEAAARHRHETELRAEAVHVDAQQRRSLIEEAVGYQREADGFEAEFVMVDAGIEQLRRTRVSVEADRDRLATQRTLLEEADRNAQLRARVASDESKSAENAAFEAARRLRGVIREIETLRSGELNDAYTAAASTLDGAASTLLAGARGDASRDGKDANGVIEGLLQQAIGDLQRARGTGAAGYAALLSRLTSIEPSPPDRNDYLAMLTRVRADRDAALQAAGDAFASAADALERVGGSDEVRERLGRVVTSLRHEQPGPSDGASGALDGEIGG
jgi:prefoldin subunit 5